MTQELHGVISLGGTVVAGSLAQRGLKGDTGVGIESVVMDASYDLTITYTDGDVDVLDTGLDTYAALLEGYKSDAVTAKNDAVNAKTAAQSAQTAAETAQGKAETAQGKAEAAQTAAETAQGLAEAAQTAAETAQGKAEDAQGYAEDAQTAAETAQGKAEDAQTAAETAQGLAEDAKDSAGDYATAASGSATSAETDALKAEGYAVGEQNGTPVTNGSPYYHNNAKYFSEQFIRAFPTDTASGAIASFPDGSDLFDYLSCLCDITPVQDLHGYDKPWVGGAGKNKLDPSLLKDQAAWNQITITLKPNTTYTMSSNITSAKSDELKCYFYIEGGSPGDSNLIYANHSASVTTDSSGGLHIQQRRVSGTDSFANYQWQIEEGSTATTYSPYSNICPITGWTGCEVSVAGVNVWDEEWEVGGINTSGQETTTSGYYRSKNYTEVIPSTTYYMKTPVTMSVMFYDSSKGFIDWTTASNSTITTPSNCHYLRFRNTTANSWTPYNNDISINYPSTDTTYHAYNGTTYPVSWQTEAGTVYGGTVDLVSGVLTVDRAIKSGTVIDANAGTYTNIVYGRVTKGTDNKDYGTSHNTAISNMYEVKLWGTSWDSADNIGKMFSGAQTGTYWIGFPVGTTLAEMQSITENNVFCYELATPQTYQLTPQTIQTLLGRNNVWADTGDTSVTYKADVQLWVEKKLE